MTFPVSYNTAVTVSCSGDMELRGDNVITCNQDTEFLFNVKPKCNELGELKNISISLLTISAPKYWELADKSSNYLISNPRMRLVQTKLVVHRDL